MRFLNGEDLFLGVHINFVKKLLPFPIRKSCLHHRADLNPNNDCSRQALAKG